VHSDGSVDTKAKKGLAGADKKAIRKAK